MFEPNSHYSNRFSLFEWILFEWNYSNVYVVSPIDYYYEKHQNAQKELAHDKFLISKCVP